MVKKIKQALNKPHSCLFSITLDITVNKLSRFINQLEKRW